MLYGFIDFTKSTVGPKHSSTVLYGLTILYFSQRMVNHKQVNRKFTREHGSITSPVWSPASTKMWSECSLARWAPALLSRAFRQREAEVRQQSYKILDYRRPNFFRPSRDTDNQSNGVQLTDILGKVVRPGLPA